MEIGRKHPFGVALFFALGILLPVMVIVALAVRNQQGGDETVLFPDGETGDYRGTVIDPPVQLDDFALPASTGETLGLSSFRGKWVLLFFGFTHCPDICPTTLVDYARVMPLLGEAAEQLQVVFISVDGERDTPDVLARYVTRFHPSFIGLQGNPQTLDRIQPQFGLWYEIAAHDSNTPRYNVDHSARTYLIDAEGRLRISYSFGTEIEIFAESIQQAILGR